jgi:DNA-binding NtrC family response regulator
MVQNLQEKTLAPFTTLQRGTKRVLVAEDDEEMRSLIVSALRCDGWDVFEARDGTQLRSVLLTTRTQPIDLVVSDIRMPGSSGLQILEWLRDRGDATPVIVMTGFGDAWIRDTVEHLDAIFFDKPFELDDLRTAVLHTLRDR